MFTPSRHSVVRVEYNTVSQFWLRQVVKGLSLDVWADAPGIMDVRIEPEHLELFLKRVKSRGYTASVIIDDLQM